MGRLKDLRKYVDAEINKIEDADKRTGAIAHLYGVTVPGIFMQDTKEISIEKTY